jgi:CRP-like cAMP-binding protein
MDTSVARVIEEFFKRYPMRKYGKGQILIFSGEGGDVVYNLVSGRVKQYDVTYRGDEIILNVFKPPTFFPMWLAINHSQNAYIFEAETEIVVRQAPASAVVRFLHANPSVLFDLLGRVYIGIDGLLGRMVHLMAGSAKARLIYELLVACRRFGKKGSNGEWVLVMSESDLGARAGLSRETVSREMNKLVNENLVKMTRGGIIVDDIGKLEIKLGQVF